MLPPMGKIRWIEPLRTPVGAAVVLMVITPVTTAVPVIAGGAVVTAQVGVSVAPVGLEVTAHERVTVPVKPALGVIVIGDVPLAPAEVMVIGVVPPNAKLGVLDGPLTMTVTFAVWVRLPDVPVTIKV